MGLLMCGCQAVFIDGVNMPTGPVSNRQAELAQVTAVDMIETAARSSKRALIWHKFMATVDHIMQGGKLSSLRGRRDMLCRTTFNEMIDMLVAAAPPPCLDTVTSVDNVNTNMKSRDAKNNDSIQSNTAFNVHAPRLPVAGLSAERRKFDPRLCTDSLYTLGHSHPHFGTRPRGLRFDRLRSASNREPRSDKDVVVIDQELVAEHTMYHLAGGLLSLLRQALRQGGLELMEVGPVGKATLLSMARRYQAAGSPPSLLSDPVGITRKHSFEGPPSSTPTRCLSQVHAPSP